LGRAKALPAYLAGMNAFTPFGLLLAYQPLLLERSYGGAGEGLGILVQALLVLLALGIVLLALLKLAHQANEVYGQSFHKFLNAAGIIAALLLVVYFLSSMGAR
jgi:hypothetical protein